jgi:hypothetical protein
LYNRPEVAAIPSGLSPTPLILIKKSGGAIEVRNKECDGIRLKEKKGEKIKG